MCPVGIATVCLLNTTLRKIGKAGVKVDVATFRKHCRDYASKRVAGQKPILFA